jgi:hypothetical protein
VRLSIRGVSIVMHEQTADHWCPIQLSIPRTDDTPDTPVPLVTTFLASGLRPTSDSPMRYDLHLKILSLRERHGIFHFREHLERVTDLDDILIVDIGQRDGVLVAWATWNSQIPGSVRDYQATGILSVTRPPSPRPGSRSCIYRRLSSRSSAGTPGSSSPSHQGHSKEQNQGDQ